MNTTTPTLTDRYVAAAARSVPESQRDDIAAELRGSIVDQIDGRIEAGENPDAAERAVLTDLGDPDKLAAAYTDRPSWLIGPRYYFEWWPLTKLLLWIVPACAVFGVTLGKTIAGDSFGEIMGAVWPVLINVIVHVGFWTTLVFAILERAGNNAGKDALGEWTPDRLPELREDGAKLSYLVASLVFLGLVAGAVLWDRFVGFAYVSGEWMPFLAPDLWPWWTTALFAALAIEAIIAVAVYAKGSDTWAFAGINLVLNVVIAVPAVWLLTEGRLINPEFWPGVIPADSSSTVEQVMTVIFAFLIAGIALWDSIDGFLKARRARGA